MAAPYTAAVVETDFRQTKIRIFEAIGGIEQRRSGPVETGSDAERALLDAEQGLNALITERLNGDSER